MKLQIVEYRVINVLGGYVNYHYILEFDEKYILWTPPTPSKKELKKVYSILMNKLLDKNIDLNPEHWVKLGKLKGIDRKVLFEQEVPETYLKELKIERRIKEIEKDFI